ncbi:MAG: hypothetical protein GEV28_03715 [Actinophytocola sp.]|uniref:UGSC family (seleno)protein n=1 Tax=Actinophytocola sp. TaxID=1872138 RepID=UPI001320D276|nr:hypothetical protein [Actinophytocola sp.]MPZ79539.1 hypothetical protein [Actinophytocola sp.]
MTLHVFRPVPFDDQQQLQFARRLDTLRGKRVGFIGNLKPNCDVLLHTTEDLLGARQGIAGTVYREKASCSSGAPVAMLDEIGDTCDAAVVALGD